MLEIHDSLSGEKRAFTPINPPQVDLYVCGMTVYDLCHLGHARAMVVFDAVVRYLRYRDYRVRYIRNITDIDDKIIRRAAELGEPIDRLTERFIEAMHEDADALGCLRPDEEPRATAHMREIIGMIEQLIAKGYAYAPAVMSTMPSRSLPITVRSPASDSMNSGPARVLHRESISAIRLISCSGRPPVKVNRAGLRPGVMVGRAGILSAQRCQRIAWAIISIFMAAGLI